MQIYLKLYRKLFFLPTLILILSILFLFSKFILFGKIIDLGFSLRGGSAAVLSIETIKNKSIEEIKAFLSARLPDFSIRFIEEFGRTKAIVLETTAKREELQNNLEALGITLNPALDSIQTISPTLAKGFFKSLIKALIFTFLAMALLIFLIFKRLIVSGFIILTLISDLIVTFTLASLFGIKIETGGLIAFLLLIGYGVDTNILLTNKMMRFEGGIDERLGSAFKIGILMSLTSLIASLIGFLLIQSELVKQILLIINFGLVADIINTWIQNANLLTSFVQKRLK